MQWSQTPPLSTSIEAVVVDPVKPPTAVSSPSSTTSEKLDLVQKMGKASEKAAESHLGVFILGKLLQRLVAGLYTCSLLVVGDQ